MKDPVRVEEERSRSDRRAFIDFPYRLYRGHPTWVPPLRIAEAALMNPKKNPFFEHAEGTSFTAHRNGKCVGRITAQIDREHLARYKCPRSIDFHARLPRDPNGKLYKRRLRELYREQ